MKMRADYEAMQTAYEARLESSQEQLEGLKEIHKVQMEEMAVLMDTLTEISRHLHLILVQ